VDTDEMMGPLSVKEAKKRIRKQGPCAMCGWHPYAAHRRIDTEMYAVANGEPIASVAQEYGEESVQAMVTKWTALLQLLQDRVERVER
jgi:hypothetical protein